VFSASGYRYQNCGQANGAGVKAEKAPFNGIRSKIDF
jgi:hypothetical protein